MSGSPELSPVERQGLKARAHHLSPVVIIGDAGLTPSVLREVNLALMSHELIKVRVAGDDREMRQEIYQTICTELNAAPVQAIGKLLVLYRPKPEEKTAAAKPRKPSGPRKTKKQLAERPAPRKTARK
ncbi:MAG TPA: ribosome assembly RNA-binding protein YhbY [Burkholderiales bacterium]|jgi:putative YhbY family RNA-binding protein